MKVQGATLTEEERVAVARYLGSAGPVAIPEMSGFCAAGAKPEASKSSWNGWSPDNQNTRFQPAPRASTPPTLRRWTSNGLPVFRPARRRSDNPASPTAAYSREATTERSTLWTPAPDACTGDIRVPPGWKWLNYRELAPVAGADRCFYLLVENRAGLRF